MNTLKPVEQTGEEWDLVIEPKHSWFNLQLNEVWRYRDLLMLLVKRDFVSFYKQTILGPLWFFIQPLFTTLIYIFIFSRLAGLSTDGLPAPLFYLYGIIAWNYFAECLTKTSTVFRDNTSLFGKVYFPRLIMPLSIIVSSLVRFGVQLVLLILALLYYVVFQDFELKIGAHILLFPIMILLMAMLGLGLGMLFSAMTTKYRDLAFLLSFGVQLLMYATPVIYPLSAAPARMKEVLSYNPLAPIVEGIRSGLFGVGEFNWGSFTYACLATMICLFAGIVVFNKVERNFVDTV